MTKLELLRFIKNYIEWEMLDVERVVLIEDRPELWIKIHDKAFLIIAEEAKE